jgi:hypothetical protein
MNPHRACVPMLMACLASGILPGVASAGAWLLAPGEYYSEFRGSFRSASTFHDNGGERQAFPGGGLREERELVSYNELGWKKSATFILAIPALSRTVRFDRSSFTQTGLADINLGLRLKLIGGATAVAVQADWTAPLGYDRDAFPALGSGQQDATGRLLFGTALLGRGFIDVASGYRYRFESPLDELLISGDLGVWIGPSFLAAGHYAYTKSVGTATVPEQEIETHLAGPQLTYRVDDRLDVFAGSTHTASARNALHADRYYVGVALKRTALGPLQGFLGGKRRP